MADIGPNILLILHLVLLILAHLIGGGVLVLLVFRNQVVHVAFRLRKLHLIHALSGVPVEEGFSPKHGGKLLGDAPKQLLDSRAVADKRGGHFETAWRDVAHCRLDIIGDPFHEVAAVFVLDAQHLLVDFFHGHAAAENGRHGAASAAAWPLGAAPP